MLGHVWFEWFDICDWDQWRWWQLTWLKRSYKHSTWQDRHFALIRSAIVLYRFIFMLVPTPRPQKQRVNYNYSFGHQKIQRLETAGIFGWICQDPKRHWINKGEPCKSRSESVDNEIGAWKIVIHMPHGWSHPWRLTHVCVIYSRIIYSIYMCIYIFLNMHR